MLGLPCSVGSSSVVTVNTGCSVAVVLRFLLSLVAERRLWGLWEELRMREDMKIHKTLP